MSEMLSVDPLVLLAITGMSLVTILTRVSGFVLARRFAIEGRTKAALEAVPGSILIAIIAPTVFTTGPAETIASLITLVLASRLPFIVAVFGGIGSVVLLRAFL
ncbi:MAG: AzlD family protein, partial [Gammaproteobacteria bacterium]